MTEHYFLRHIALLFHSGLRGNISPVPKPPAACKNQYILHGLPGTYYHGYFVIALTGNIHLEGERYPSPLPFHFLSCQRFQTLYLLFRIQKASGGILSDKGQIGIPVPIHCIKSGIELRYPQTLLLLSVFLRHKPIPLAGPVQVPGGDANHIGCAQTEIFCKTLKRTILFYL